MVLDLLPMVYEYPLRVVLIIKLLKLFLLFRSLKQPVIWNLWKYIIIFK
jgi:hypothetical protein